MSLKSELFMMPPLVPILALSGIPLFCSEADVGCVSTFSLLIFAESIIPFTLTGGKFEPFGSIPVLIYFRNAYPVEDESGTRIGCFCEL